MPPASSPDASKSVVRVHGSCASLDGAAVLLRGNPGTGKSDLLLRLIDRGFSLVADDQVDVEDGYAAAPANLAGLIEVRGLGIVRLPFVSRARLVLMVELGKGDRLPYPASCPVFGVSSICIEPERASAAQVIALALALATGHQTMLIGAFQ